MNRFPGEFSELLTDAARKHLTRFGRPPNSGLEHGGDEFHIFPGIISPRRAAECTDLLTRTMDGHVRPSRRPVPPEAIWGMKKNYEDLLPKTQRIWTAMFLSRSSKAFLAARRIGMERLLHSESLARIAETVTGWPLERPPSMQLIRYRHGDHVGPHHDHHPEHSNTRHGYVDVHIMFTNPDVQHQWLLCGHDGYLGKIYDACHSGTLTIYKLPMWHQTTPLTAKPGRQETARRWLLTATYYIDPERWDFRRKAPKGKAT